MGWQFWIDRGGTFTDIVARAPDGRTVSDKLLSENPEQYDDAAIAGIRRLLHLEGGEALPADQIDSIKMGTTVATNALLERQGTPTVLAITRGFADALFIGTQNRPSLFDLDIKRPDVLYSDVIEIEERLFCDGATETPLNETRTAEDLKAAFDKGFRAIAIVLLHADRHPQHEETVAALARAAGFEQVSASHDVIPLMKLIGRGDTTVADAYLSPILRHYVQQVEGQVRGSRLFFMQSNGGLTQAHRFRGKDAILSGPAGGVVSLAAISASTGLHKVIGFDMGGTSTDVSHYAGTFERTFDSMVAGVRIRAPMMQIHTVAAGGGSKCVFDGLRFRVGPESAGANPGPAAYRRGGPLTVTDCNVLLGRIQPQHFPSVFGPNADEQLDIQAVRRAFTALSEDVERSLGEAKSPVILAEDFLTLAIENMANAIKTISVQRGYDVTEYALVTFGGAGGQHACQVADALGMQRILIHPLSGVLSAYGMGMADIRDLRQKTLAVPLTTDDFDAISDALAELAEEAIAEISDQGVEKSEATLIRMVFVRYAGSDTTLSVPFGDVAEMIASFEKLHNQHFGFIQPGTPLVAETVSVEAMGGGSTPEEPVEDQPASPLAAPKEHVEMVCAGKPLTVPLYDRLDLKHGHVVQGPAMIVEANATTVVEPEWQAEVTQRNDLLLSRRSERPKQAAIGTDADPVKIEVFNSLFMAIAERMGAALQNTAHSVNIKERLDFSCAVFDCDGALVANAPHMPVHLGSMGESVRAILDAHGDDMRPGDAFVTNAPYNGGTHLPDVTVVSPVFDASDQDRVFFVAARGHHSDIGGISPGSMPPHSRSIDEEGVLFDAIRIVRAEQFLEDDVRSRLESARYPARSVDQNIADLKAQLAACKKGAAELQDMIEHFGLAGVKAYTHYVQLNAEEAVRRVIAKLNSGSFEAPLDDGSTIRVAVSVDQRRREATIDFTGTSSQRPSNFNAPAAVVRAAVLYVFRTLVEDDIPMNEGCLKPLNLIIPDGSMLSPRPPAAVVAGNVETSQVVCDALYGALGRLAASQGTMNNLTFGNDSYQYYETLCGGAGAGPTFDGADAVHTHMTNSRLTDPEVLEWRYPVLVESFKVRSGSGGAGRFKGGDGVERRIRFREPMTVAILSGRRSTHPFGLSGGSDGLPGITTADRADGTTETLSYADSTDVASGDAIVVATPGGGGFGPSDEQ